MGHISKRVAKLAVPVLLLLPSLCMQLEQAFEGAFDGAGHYQPSQQSYYYQPPPATSPSGTTRNQTRSGQWQGDCVACDSNNPLLDAQHTCGRGEFRLPTGTGYGEGSRSRSDFGGPGEGR